MNTIANRPLKAGSKIDLSRIKRIENADVKGKRVLVRVDFNVPIQDGVVGDTTRIERVLPTIKKLQAGGAKVVVLSHLGRPKTGTMKDTTLKAIADKIAELMPDTKVTFIDDCVGEKVKRGIDALKPGEIVVLENLRYHDGEKKNDPAFAKELAALGDIYVNDAFSTAHRAHASVEAITKFIPSYAGLLMMAEIDALGAALDHPKRPVMAIAGGSKVSTKIAVLTNLTARMDALVLGGGMASTFLFAQGVEIGKSLCQPEAVDTVKAIMARAKEFGCEIVLPKDFVVAKELKAGAEWKVCDVGNIPADQMIVDIGPETVADLKKRFAQMKTILWNGPVGAFEYDPFGEGTFALVREAARLAREGKLTVIAGGGDTVAALNITGTADDFTYVSTAGGAFLEWLEGRELPAVAALAKACA
jgi:phosphoglycerate kinase